MALWWPLAGRATNGPDAHTLREQYAQLCARGDQAQAADRYQTGWDDFPILCGFDLVTCVGINVEEQRLYVGTACIDVVDETGQLREIGEFIIGISRNPPTYRLDNVTRKIDESDHPHIYQGNLCITGREIIACAIADGKISEAVRILLAALSMRSDEVTIGTPYQKARLEFWPLKLEA